MKAFFDEGEVPEDISSLTRSVNKEPEELSITRGTFTWTKGGSAKPTDADKTSTAPTPASASESGATDEAAATASVSTRTAVDHGEQVFELKDITVKIIPRKLTVCLSGLTKALTLTRGLCGTQVVTGSTASGKTALLVWWPFDPIYLWRSH